MKKTQKLFTIFLTALAIMFAATFTVSAAGIPDPYVVGSDVYWPDAFIQTIPGATDGNVWNRLHDEVQPWVKMSRVKTEKGIFWVSPNSAGKRCHPYVGDPNDYLPEINHCKVEMMPWKGKTFVIKYGSDINLLVTK